MGNFVDYQTEVSNNEQTFKNIVSKVRPDLYAVMSVMDEQRINYAILLKYMRHLAEVANGTKYGKVITEVENSIVTFIDALQRDRVQEPILTDKNPRDFYG